MPRPLPALNLRADLLPVAEGEHHPAVRIVRRVLHKPVEQLLVEIHRQLRRFAKPRNETAENIILDFLPLPFLLQAVLPALQGGVPAGADLSVFPSLICDFCPSDQEFAYSFLQIPPHDGHPCCSAIHFLVA